MTANVQMLSIRSAAFAMILAMAFAVPGQSQAAPRTVAEIANYSGADRQAVLEAGAKKEGSVQVYTTGAQTQPIYDKFQKQHPYIRIEVFRPGGSPAVVRRIIEEYKVGRHIVDGIFLATAGLHALRDAEILQPFYSPESAKYREEAIESNKLWVVDKESYLGLGYNTKEMAGQELPKTYDDLLAPKWKRKLTVSAQGETLTMWTGAIILAKGEDYLRKLSRQNFTVYSVGGRGLSNLVVSGEVPLSPAIYSGHMANSKRKGGNVGWRALGPVYANLGGDAIAKHAPHPHATMMLIDFFLSRGGQGMYQTFGYATARTDMDNPDRPEKALYLSERPNFATEFEHWSKLTRDLFGKGKKPAKKKK